MKLRTKRKIEFVEALGGKCMKCSEDDIRVLIFHHINGRSEKDGRNWSTRTNHLRKLIENGEMLLLCHNCHHILHHPDGYLEYRKNKKVI